MSVREQFERELTERGFSFEIDPDSGCYLFSVDENQLTISLANLELELADGVDADRVARFVDTMLASAQTTDRDYAAERLYWTLEPNDYQEKADYCVAVSDVVDRVLVHLSECGTMITWVTPSILETLGLSLEEAGERAFANLAREVEEATLEAQSVDDAALGYLVTALPFKAALILAPNLRQLVEEKLGWPVMAVLPDRDFLYMWGAQHQGLTQRVGHVVVREYTRSPYSITTEVFRIDDSGVRAIGAFPVPEESPE
ncbi:hypothetical protein C5Y96_06690 [Blastopirellula marina]|uniref:DUF1444 domain-containing protein n=1 Tax=Blastopirellula marina TaxID=124 RepID=A0A2S8FXF0_9BACT|nr:MULTISPECIES: hypothetical protein [Pirellulaceae]PQO36848.1 hypothetical protein C5Y96_06690 [Blastopirellula marina]RCS53563.1 hypothetical protein DTL36_06700 [Bremerella cremea]